MPPSLNFSVLVRVTVWYMLVVTGFTNLVQRLRVKFREMKTTAANAGPSNERCEHLDGNNTMSLTC